MYIKPYYVSEVETKEGEVILFNPVNHSLALIPTDLATQYKEGQKKGSYQLYNEDLINRFFVKKEEPIDEDALLMEMRNRVVSPNILFLTIMPTEQCNFRCVYCYEKFEKGEMKKETADGLLTYVENNIDKYSGLVVSWFGGEPLLAMKTVEYLSEHFIDICKAHKKSYTANMTTNGYLLDLKNMEKLYRFRVFEFQITLDGGQLTHDKQRVLRNGGGTYETIVQNLKAIKSSFRKKFLKITLRTNLTTDIIQNSIHHYLDLVREFFVGDSMFDFRFRVAWDGKSHMKNHQEGDKIFIQTAADAYQYVYSLLSDIPGMDFSSEFKEISTGGGVCYAAKENHYVIGSDGTIYKCTVNFHDPINSIGVVTDEGEFKMDADKLEFWKPLQTVQKECKKCVSKMSCMGIGCPYRQHEHNSCGAITEQVSFILPFIAKSNKGTIKIDSI